MEIHKCSEDAMTPLALIIKRLRRLPRQHRIAHLQALVRVEKKRSVRRQELEAMLRDERTAQIRKELVHLTREPASPVIGHPAAEFAS